MESELRDARRSASEEEMRAKLYTVKSLCELLLDESSTKGTENEAQAKPFVAGGSVPERKREKENPALEDDFAGANGDSIFDF